MREQKMRARGRGAVAGALDIMAQKKDRQVRATLRKEDPSSREKSTPPTGAPKAAATPAAAPADTKSRFSWSLRNSWQPEAERARRESRRGRWARRGRVHVCVERGWDGS